MLRYLPVLLCLGLLAFIAGAVEKNLPTANQDSAVGLVANSGTFDPATNWMLKGNISSREKIAVSDIGTRVPLAPSPASKSHPVRTCLILLHVLGLLLGMGSAIFLDLLLLGRLYFRPLESATVATVRFGSRVISAGLALLWITGIGFLLFYWATAPDMLSNPKIWAKMTIVTALTINGFAIHYYVIPSLPGRIGAPILFHGRNHDHMKFILTAIISSVSWVFAMTLGLVKEINYAVPAIEILASYLAVVMAAFAAGYGLNALISHGGPQGSSPQAT